MTTLRSQQNGSISISELLERIASRKYPHLDKKAEYNDKMYSQWFEKSAAKDEWSKYIRGECARGNIAACDPRYGIPARPEVLDESQWLKCLVSSREAEIFIRQFGDEDYFYDSIERPAMPVPSQAQSEASLPTSETPSTPPSDSRADTRPPSAGPVPYVPAGIGPIQARAHKLKNKRHALGHIIEMAKRAASEPDNYLSVWPELVRLAESRPPPVPLIGYVDGEGIKYRASGKNPEAEVKTFTKDALRKQMDPNAR